MNRRTDNVVDMQRSNERFFSSDSRLRVGEEPALASHLVTARALYSHHGIYVGNRRVIHYAGPSHGLFRGPVEDVSLEYFARGRAIRVRHDRPRFDRGEVVARARSRLGERRYRILTNNCEHFSEWCLNGASRSTQVERLLSGARRFACALLGTLGLAAGTPTFADPASQLSARAVGEGPTTTVLVAGLGDTHDVWADVQPLIAASCARTFAYTPAGYERSAPALRGETPDSRLRVARLQLEIAADFPAAANEGSGQYIQHDRPEVVINSARELAGCSRAIEPAVGPGPPDCEYGLQRALSRRVAASYRSCSGHGPLLLSDRAARASDLRDA